MLSLLLYKTSIQANWIICEHGQEMKIDRQNSCICSSKLFNNFLMWNPMILMHMHIFTIVDLVELKNAPAYYYNGQLRSSSNILDLAFRPGKIPPYDVYNFEQCITFPFSCDTPLLIPNTKYKTFIVSVKNIRQVHVDFSFPFIKMILCRIKKAPFLF